MRKIIFFLLACLTLYSCSFFKPKTIPYPRGVFFPLEKDGEIQYKGKIISPIQKEGKNFYLSTKKGFVYGIDGKERKIAWLFEADNELVSPPYLGQKNIFVYDKNTTLYCLDKEGKLRWKKKIEEKITSGVREDKGKIYFGTEKGVFFALDLSKGKKLWSLKAGEAIRSTPVIADGMIIFGSDDRFLYFLDEEGKVLDRFETGDKIRATPLVDGNSLYFGSDDHYFYCLDLKKRKKKWRVKIGCKIVTSPVTDRRSVLFLCMNGILYSLNKKNGTFLWWRAVPSRSFFHLAKIEERIVASSLSSLLVSFKIDTGERVGTFDADEVVQSNPVWLEPHLLINLYDFRKGEGSLVYLKKVIQITLWQSEESPQKTGEELLFVALATGFYMPIYEFYLSRLTKVDFNPPLFILSTEWERKVVQEKSEKKSWEWIPEEPGAYVVGVKVVDEKEKAETLISYVIEKEKAKVSLLPSKESPQKPEEKIIFNTKVTAFYMPKYEFDLSRLTKVDFNPPLFILSTEWERKVVQEKSEMDSWEWIPEEPGAYVVAVRVVDEKEKAEARISFVIEKRMDKEMKNLMLFLIYWIKIIISTVVLS